MTTDSTPKLPEMDESRQIKHLLKAKFLSRTPAYLRVDYSEDIGNRIGWGIYAEIVFNRLWPVTSRTQLMMPDSTTDYSRDFGPQKIGVALSVGARWGQLGQTGNYIKVVQYTETARVAYNDELDVLWVMNTSSRLEDEMIDIGRAGQSPDPSTDA